MFITFKYNTKPVNNEHRLFCILQKLNIFIRSKVIINDRKKLILEVNCTVKYQ